MKTITLSDARQLYARGLLTMRVDSHDHIVALVNGVKVKITRPRRPSAGAVARAAYYARSLRIGG